MIDIKNLSFSYSTKKVLDDISFIGNNGDIIAILGQNGAGKSTLLKCLNGILKPNSGSILIDSKNILDLSSNEKAKLLSYVPQDIMFGDFCIFDAVLMGRKPYIKFDSSNEDLKITSDILKKFNLEDMALNNVNEISGGERQKVAIARTLAQDSSIILFDEPTSNLDLKNQLSTISMIKEIVKNNKIAIITMHDLNMAMRLANKFLFLKDNKIYAFGNENIITKKLVKDIYEIDVEIVRLNNHKTIIIK